MGGPSDLEEPRDLSSTKSSGAIPVIVSGSSCPGTVPRSTSQTSLQMAVRNQETKRRGHLLHLPPAHLTTSCLAFRERLLAGKRVWRHTEKLMGLEDSRKDCFHTGSVGCQFCQFAPFLHFQETEKNSARRVFHCEAKLLSLRVPCACAWPPASSWTWTRLLGAWIPGEMSRSQPTLSEVHRFTRFGMKLGCGGRREVP